MSFSNKKTEQQLLLILDVQSSVVRGALVLSSPKEKPQVLFTSNSDLPFNIQTDPKSLIETTLKAIEENVGAAKKFMNSRKSSKEPTNIPGKISAVHYALSSPWIVSEAKALFVSFEKETKITREYIRDLIQKERARLMKFSSEPVRIVEEKIFDVRLNGYSISEWQGKETRKLDVSFTISQSGKRMTELFIERCAPIVHKNIFFHSSLLLQNIAVDKARQGGESYVLIHIHGEITDVSVIHHESCVFFGSLASGLNTLVRKISAATGNDIKAADSLLELYTAGHLDETHGKNSIAIVDGMLQEWAGELKKLLRYAGVDIVPPLSIIISAKAYDNAFVRTLKETFPEVKTVLLEIEDLLPLVTFDKQTERRRLTAMYAIALNTLIH